MVIDFSNINGGGGGGYVLPIASNSVLGGVKVGQNLSIDSGGTLSADAQAVGVATTASTGVVQVGSGLSITSGGVLSTDIDLSDYAEKSDLNNYATVESLSGYVETSAMSGYQTTDAMSGYVETSDLETFVPNYAMALKSLQEGDENYYKVVNYSGLLYYVDYNKSEEENIFVKVKYDAEYVSVDMDIDGQTDTVIIAIGNDGFYFTISIDKNGDLFYVNENDDEVYFDSEVSEYQYGDFIFYWNNDGKHIEFSQQTQMIEVDVFTDNCEYWHCVGQEMRIASEDEIGLVKIGEGIDLAEDGTISVSEVDVERATTTNWGSMLLGNGVGVEVDGVLALGVSAGENIMYGNGEGVNDSGAKAPIWKYTQYSIDIDDDDQDCIILNDNGSFTIDIDNLDLGNNEVLGNLIKFENSDGRYIQLFFENDGLHLVLNPNTRAALPNVLIDFGDYAHQYKSIRIEYDDGGETMIVYGKYDGYTDELASLEYIVDFTTINKITIFDKDHNMEGVGIGTIKINNTDIIKPYFEWDGNELVNCGFVLRQRSYAPTE